MTFSLDRFVTEIRDAAELRVKEVDRIELLATELRKLGARVETQPDGMILSGPTALTFVKGDVAGAAKALRDSAKTLPDLVVKGGVLGEAALSAADVKALADLPSRDELLAKFAGALQAPLVKTAGLLQALPRNFAYGLNALIEKQAA